MSCVQLTKIVAPGAGWAVWSRSYRTQPSAHVPEGPGTPSLQAATHHALFASHPALFARTCAEQVVQRRKQLVHALQATGTDNNKG